MAEQKNFFIASRICFRSSSHSWLNHRQGRMTYYVDNISLCNEMIGAENFDKLDHLQQLLLEEMCNHIRRRLTALSIQYCLKHTVPRLNDSDVASLLRKSVTFVQYRAFMRSIFGYLLPLELIGKCNMKLAVDRISSALFKLGTAFYVTPENRTKLLRFYRKDVWKRIENHNFRLLSERRDLKKIKGVMKKTVGARIRFLPKNSGTRSLIVPTGKSSQRHYSTIALKMVSAIIDLVCAEQRKCSKELPFTGAAVWNGIGGFPKRFRRFIQMNGSARIYAVKTDVRECFDCINQNVLRSILKKLILLTKHFRLNANVIGMSSLIFARRYGFRCEIDNHNCNLSELCITGEMVMWFLETYVINKEFEYRDGVYRAFRGIPQGNHASTRLCDLYLGAADCKRYSDMMRRRDTLLIRYVDDYLLLTTDINVARKFLETMHLGTDDSFNVIAESTKTVINFYCECNELLISAKMVSSCGAIPWCGYIIYPGLKRYCIDWAKIRSEKAIACRIVHKLSSRQKRIAVLRFLRASLLEKYRMIRRFHSDKWKIRVLKKFAAIGMRLYARPFARKVRLSMKGRWNRVFWQKLRAWLRQGCKTVKNCLIVLERNVFSEFKRS
ncbi:Telomerase reverse transcriptase [Dirofilaria immitis]